MIQNWLIGGQRRDIFTWIDRVRIVLEFTRPVVTNVARCKVPSSHYQFSNLALLDQSHFLVHDVNNAIV